MKRYTAKYWNKNKWVVYHTNLNPWSNHNVRLAQFVSVRLNKPIKAEEIYAAMKKMDWANDQN